MAISKEKLDELEAKYGRIAHVPGHKRPDGTHEWECVFRKASRAEFKLYKRNAHNPATAPDAQELLAIQLVVVPNRDEFEKLLEEYPGIPEACGEALQLLIGMAKDETAK